MKFDKLSHKVIGICLKVHKELKTGFPEIVYHRALKLEFKRQRINHYSEYPIPIYYQKELISTRKADFLINKKLILEIKATPILNNNHFIQALNYVEATNIASGLLINFGSKYLEIKRLFNKKL